MPRRAKTDRPYTGFWRGRAYGEPVAHVPPPLTTDEPQTGVIGPIRRLEQVREWRLVLSSMGITSVLRDGPEGWVLLVDGTDHARALHAIRLYETENRDWPSKPQREVLPYAPSLA